MNRLLRRKTRYIAFVAASIDGRISLSHTHPPDWTSKEDWTFFQASLARMDAVVVGRNTYSAVAERLRARNTFVLSRCIRRKTRRGTVTFLNPETAHLADLLVPYRTVGVLGGSAVYGYMLENGLLDELFLTIEPLLFGRGSEMCCDVTKTARAQLRSVKRLNHSGTLLLHYIIHHA